MLPVNSLERLVCTLMMLFSSMLWCYVIGTASGIAATLDPDGRTGASAAQALGPQRMVFVHCDGREEADKNSAMNSRQAEVVIAALQTIRAADASVLVLTPYKAQVRRGGTTRDRRDRGNW